MDERLASSVAWGPRRGEKSAAHEKCEKEPAYDDDGGIEI